MMFCNIIAQIGLTWAPVVAELSLECSAAEPVELHVHGLESFACNIVGYDSQGCCVISLHGRWGLFVSHFLKGMSCRDGLAAIDEKGA